MRPLVLCAVACALCVGTANAAQDSLTPGTASEFAAARASAAAQAATADVAAERLRAGLVLNPEGFLGSMSPLEVQALQSAFGRIGAREATHLAWYFRSAATRQLSGGSRPVVLYYNALADVGALTTWRQVDGVWRVVAAQLTDGAALRSGPAGYWIDAGGEPYRQALATRAAASFHPRGEIALASNPAQQLERLRERSNALQAAVAALRADRDRAVAAEVARRALAAARNPAPDGPSTAQLQTLSPDVRRTLALVGVFRTGDGEALAFASPLQPALLIFVDLDSAHRAHLTGAVNFAAEPRS